MLEKTVKISVLYDLYNQILTEKQRDIVDLYYNQDLSLGEIADEFNISRQAVYDMLKRTEKLLYQYEEKLGFVKLLEIKNEKIREIINKVVDLEKEICLNNSSKEFKSQINEIKKVLNDLL